MDEMLMWVVDPEIRNVNMASASIDWIGIHNKAKTIYF
jgi:hypothetical protein